MGLGKHLLILSLGIALISILVIAEQTTGNEFVDEISSSNTKDPASVQTYHELRDEPILETSRLDSFLTFDSITGVFSGYDLATNSQQSFTLEETGKFIKVTPWLAYGVSLGQLVALFDVPEMDVAMFKALLTPSDMPLNETETYYNFLVTPSTDTLGGTWLVVREAKNS